jgi:hypothetical protein
MLPVFQVRGGVACVRRPDGLGASVAAPDAFASLTQ